MASNYESTAAGSGGTAGAAVASTAERLREEGRQIAETARASAMRAAEERKVQAAGFVRDVSSAIHKGSAELRERGRGQSADYVDLAAEELDRFGARLEGRDVGDLLVEVEHFARRRPGLLFGAALLAGFGMVRFAMSSKARAAEEQRAGQPPGGEFGRYESAPSPIDEAAAYQGSSGR